MPTALVTGANRGLGRQTAADLAARGYRVFCAARDPEKAAEAAAAVGGEPVRIDLTDPSTFNVEVGPLDVLVNNAAAAFDGFDGDRVRRTSAVNVLGTIGVTRALLPCLSSGSRIVNVSSGLGELARFSATMHARLGSSAGLDDAGARAAVADFAAAVDAGRHESEGWPTSAYGFSKLVLNAWTRHLAEELRPQGILVNAVGPGWVRTDMGGSSAPRSVEEGASGIVWAADLPADGPTGTFFRDGRVIAW